MQAILYVEESGDVVDVRRKADELATGLRFGAFERQKLLTAVSELAQNIRAHAGLGRVTFALLHEADKFGLEVSFEDAGRGIADPNKALTPGYSTAGSLGLGLPGARRMVDELLIDTAPGKGTRIRIQKWVKVA